MQVEQGVSLESTIHVGIYVDSIPLESGSAQPAQSYMVILTVWETDETGNTGKGFLK